MTEVLPTSTEQPSPKTNHDIRSWLWAASPLLIGPLAEYLIVGPVGTRWLIMLPGLLVFPALLALVYLLASPVLLIPRHSRSPRLRHCGLCLILLGCTIAGLRLAGNIRSAAFHKLAQRSTALVSAIKNYERSHGAPPPDLDALVPEFLAAIPGTGMAAYPDYNYAAGDKAKRHTQNPWHLVVYTPTGGINFDEFLYFPLQNYPQKGYGGWLQRINDWAYVHE